MALTTHRVSWGPTWLNDGVYGASVNVPDNNVAGTLSAIHDLNGEYGESISGVVHYGGVYDAPVVIYARPLTGDAGTPTSRVNTDVRHPVIGAVSASVHFHFSVYPEMEQFQLDIDNQSGAAVDVELRWKALTPESDTP